MRTFFCVTTALRWAPAAPTASTTATGAGSTLTPTGLRLVSRHWNGYGTKQ